MARSDHRRPVALAVGGALAGGLLLSGPALSMTPLAQGYLLGAQDAAADARREGTCGGDGTGEGRCGVDRLDADGDGRISQAEFAARHPEHAARFAEIDADGDGFIDRAEHEAHRAAKGAEGNCGAAKGDMEGKCGEGRCGGAA